MHQVSSRRTGHSHSKPRTAGSCGTQGARSPAAPAAAPVFTSTLKSGARCWKKEGLAQPTMTQSKYLSHSVVLAEPGAGGTKY